MPANQSVELINPVLPRGVAKPEAPVSDIADWLPDRGKRVLVDLREQARSLSATIYEISDRIVEQRTQLLRSEARLRQLQGSARDGGHGLKNDDDGVILQKQKTENERSELARLIKLSAERSERRNQLSHLVGRAEQYIRSVVGAEIHRRGKVLPEAARIKPALAKGESISDAVTRLRGKIAELKQSITAVNNAPRSPAIVKSEMRKTVAALAAAGTPSVAADGTVAFPMMRVTSPVYLRPDPVASPALNDNADAGDAWSRVINLQNARVFPVGEPQPAPGEGGSGFSASEVVDTAALFAWLHRDELIKRLEQQIDAGNHTDAMTDEQRSARRKSLAIELLEVERQEVALVQDSSGFDYRSDTNPIALLCLAA